METKGIGRLAVEDLYNHIVSGKAPQLSQLGMPGKIEILSQKQGKKVFVYFQDYSEAEVHRKRLRQVFSTFADYLKDIPFLDGKNGLTGRLVLEDKIPQEIGDLQELYGSLDRDNSLVVKFLKDAYTPYFFKFRVHFPGANITSNVGYVLDFRNPIRSSKSCSACFDETGNKDIVLDSLEVYRSPIVFNCYLDKNGNQAGKLGNFSSFFIDVLVNQFSSATNAIIKRKIKEYNGFMDEEALRVIMDSRSYEEEVLATVIVKYFLKQLRNPDNSPAFDSRLINELGDDKLLPRHIQKATEVVRSRGLIACLDFYRNSEEWDLEDFVEGKF